MKGVIEKNVLERFLKTMTPVNHEARLLFNKDELIVKETDAAHVMMVTAKLGNTAFKQYSSRTEKHGIDVEKVLECLKTMSGNIEVKFNDCLVLKDDDLTFNRRLIDITGEVMKTPKLNFLCTIKVDMDDFKKALKGAMTLDTDLVTLKVSSEGILFSSGTETDDIMVLFPLKEEDTSQFDDKMKVKSSFSVDLLQGICKNIPARLELSLSMGNNLPLKIEYSAESMGVEYLIAPRIIEEG